MATGTSPTNSVADSPLERATVSNHGAKIAAGRLRITVEEYRQHETDGESRCTDCRQWKPLAAFAANAGRVSGVANECRDCKRRIDRERYERARIRDLRAAGRRKGISYAGPAFTLTPEGAGVARDRAETTAGAQRQGGAGLGLKHAVLYPNAALAPSGHLYCPAVLGCREGRLPVGWVREQKAVAS